MTTKNFIGQDGFVWWIGIVENRIDPLNLGRCQVRIFGRHSSNDKLVPSADLPWAVPMLPVNSPQNTTFKDGDMVVGFFTDGESSQQPIIMGIIPGIPTTETNPENTFGDRRQGNTLSTAPRRVKSRAYDKDGSGIKITNADPVRYPSSLNEPTTSRLSRRENLQKTIINDRVANLDKDVPLAGGKGSWSEPSPAYNSLFPYNKVVETESGHTFEIDDTPGAERINTTHRSGTFFEIYPSGTKVEKITKSHYQIIMAENNVHIMGRCNITIDSDATVLVKGNAYLDVGQNFQARIGKNFNLSVGESFNVLAKRINIQTKKDLQASIGTQGVLNVGETLDISAKGNVNFSSGKRFKLLAGKSLEAYSPKIDLNPSSLLEVGLALLTAAYQLGAFPGVTDAVNKFVSNAASEATNTFKSTMNSFFGPSATGASPLTNVAEAAGGDLTVQATGEIGSVTVTAVDAGSSLGLTSVAASSGGLTLSPATITAVTGSGLGVTEISPYLGGLTIAPASSAVASTLSTTVPTLSGLVLNGAATGTATISLSGIVDGFIGKVVGGSVAGQILDPTKIFSSVGVNGFVDNLAGSVVTKKFLTVAAGKIADELGLPPFVTNALTKLPVLLGPGGDVTINGQEVGGFMAAGASIGSSTSSISLNSILSSDKVLAFAKDAAVYAVSVAFPGVSKNPLVRKLATKIYDSIDFKSMVITPTVGDILPTYNGTEPIADEDLPSLQGEVPVSDNVVSSSISKWFKSSDLKFDTVEPEFAGIVLSGAKTAGGGTGFQLSDEISNALDDFFGKFSLEKIVKDGVDKIIPKDIQTLLDQAKDNPSVVITALVKVGSTKVIEQLKKDTTGAFSTVLGEAGKLLNIPKDEITQAVSKYVTSVFNNSQSAKSFGLNTYDTTLDYNNALVSPEAPGIASGAMEYMQQVEYILASGSQKVIENFNQMAKSLELVTSVPGEALKEEVDAIINYHTEQNTILVKAMEDAVQITTDQMNNVVVFVVDTNV